MEAESPQYAIPGQVGELRCSVQYHRPSKLIWTKIEGQDTLFLSRDGSSDADFGVYQLANVQASNAGMYECRGHYDDREDSQKAEILLIVYSKLINLFSVYC